MKMKLFAAIAALLIVGAAGAQERDAAQFQKAKDQTESMSKQIQMDNATQEKVVEIMYTYNVAQAELAKKKDSLSEAEYRERSSENYGAWRNGIKKVIAKDQVKIFEEWRKIPSKERYAK